MPRRKQALRIQLLQLLDGLLLVAVLWLSHALRYYGTVYFDFPVRIPSFGQFFWMVAVIFPFGPLLLEIQGFYDGKMQKPFGRALGQVLRAGLWCLLLLGACVIFFRLGIPSRSVIILFGVLGCAALCARDQIWRAYLRQRARRGQGKERVAAIGPAEAVDRMLADFPEEVRMEMEVVARIDIGCQPTSDLVKALHEHSVSRVLIAGGHLHLDRIQQAVRACEEEGVEAWLAANFVTTLIARPDIEVFGGTPMLVFRSTPDFSLSLLAKTLIDKAGALAGLVLLSPFLGIAAIGIRLTSPGPILFRQLRGAKHGRPFTMFKFRTMVTDAEMRQAELQAFNQMSGPVFKVARDPRVTPFGKWLRKTSIDELPQLWNVLAGDMSLVGPRPLPLYEVEKFEHTAHRRRLSVKPGLTCLWQISGRNEVRDFQDWVQLDLQYIDNWSIWLDLKILFKTIPAVILGLGAR